jgi:hypothetical protein
MAGGGGSRVKYARVGVAGGLGDVVRGVSAPAAGNTSANNLVAGTPSASKFQPGNTGLYELSQAAGLLVNSNSLTEAEKKKMYEDLVASYGPHKASPFDPADYQSAQKSLLTTFYHNVGDAGRRVDSQKVFIQEQFNSLNQAVNSKLQQNRVTSFLGATAAKAAL